MNNLNNNYKKMQKAAKRNSISMIVLILCTITIIGTNYIFTQKSVIDINELLLENEYNKIGGKENYLILQELQKREIIGYINTIKEEQPGLIVEILETNEKNDYKVNSEGREDTLGYKILNQSIINDLKKDTFITGNSGALISIIEFSDMECAYCIKQHKKQIPEKLLENYSDKINYSFKNFPLPAHKNANIEAQAAKCVEKLEGGKKYLEYIDLIYNNTDGGGEGFKIEKLSPLAEKISVDKELFENCLTNTETKDQVDKEFKQGVMLGINSVPANLIINNETGKYTIISETIDYNEMEKIINDISK